MPTYNAQYTQSNATATAEKSSITFGTDISQVPVYLSVDIIPSHSFARLMLTLGRVVRMQDVGVQRDHSAYQDWVQGEYFKELDIRLQDKLRGLQDKLKKLPTLLENRKRLKEEQSNISKTIRKFENSQSVQKETRAFWKWLYTHNREAWLVLDPIVSVQSDATFFEAFSQDESTYARVVLPHIATTSNNEPRLGTTNIDFSLSLEKELSRTRTYRPLHLTVGADSVAIDTGVSSTVEKKIDLPESWVKGLVEVQAALSLAPIELNISSSSLADVIARLESKKEKQGPRALIFDLTIGERPKVIVQPWNETFIISDTPYTGSENRRIKVWGRRRLRVLKDLLPLNPKLKVRLIDSGMPSFWTAELDKISLTIGLSGWTAQDWAGRAQFSAIIPASDAKLEIVQQAADLLKAKGSIAVDEMSSALNSTPSESRRLLQRLCLSGSAMFDPETRLYRWRALFSTLNLESSSEAGLEERKGVDIFKQKAIELYSDQITSIGREIKGKVSFQNKVNHPIIQTDLDGRVKHAQCDCSHFRYNKLVKGPCRHIVSLSLMGGR